MENILITYFVNPHRFWFKREEFDVDEEISNFRANLNRSLRKQHFNADSWTPAVGEVVAYFQKNASVWDRAVVREISPTGNITLWIEDQGFPQRAKKKEIRPMPKNVVLPVKKIVREGGLYQVVAAKRKFNLNTMKVQMVDCGGVWAEDAIELMKEAINYAEGISFEIKSSPDRNTCYGNLIFHLPRGQKLPAEELLADYIQPSERFLELLSRDFAYKLRLTGDENSSGTSPTLNKCPVNEWVEKTIDVNEDNFDESVSTYQPPRNETIKKIPPAEPKIPKAMEQDSWTPHPLPRPQGLNRGYPDDDEDEFSIKPVKSQTVPQQRKLTPADIVHGISESSNTDISANTYPSDLDFRNMNNKFAQLEKKKFLEELQKSQNTNGLSESSRSHLMPQPAGMLRMEPSKKSKDKMQKVLRVAGMENKSPGVDVRDLGEVPVEPTAKKRYQRILVHGPLTVTMVQKITDAFFCPEVHARLKQYRIEDVHRIQSHAWPHIFRGGSTVLIAPRKSGKTLAYIPMLYTRMRQDQEGGARERKEGARAIVICESSKKVLEISRSFDCYNERHRVQLTVLASSSPCDTQDHVIELQNGYDILFTTVPGFKRLLKCATEETVDIFKLEDLQYIVVDDYDTIVKYYRKELDSVLKILTSHQDEHGKCSAQVVLTSTLWMPEFRNYLKSFDNPMLCIASGVEAALYAQSKFSLQIMTRDQKVLAVREILSTQAYFSEPTMVICNTAEEVEYLAAILRKISVSVMTFTAATLESYQMRRDAVILCTDACLLHINVRNIQNLIHFSLPEKWSIYDKRYTACFAYYEDQVTHGEPTKPPVNVYIFCDQDNDQQLPKLVDFMQKRFSNVEIAPEIVACARASLEHREQQKVTREVPLCKRMMEFGECRVKGIDCAQRHIFAIADAPSDLLPKKGFVRMKIENVRSPIHFQAHILHSMPLRSSPDTEWNIEMQSDKFYVFQNDLNRHMMVEWNQVTPPSKDIKEMDIYVLPFDHKYLRVRVDSITREGSHVMVTVSGVDSPRNVDALSAQDLFVLPEAFREFPHQLIDVRYVGVVPNDHEMAWDRRSTEKVKEWINEANQSSNYSFHGEIELTLHNTIYVKSLFCVEYFDDSRINCVKFSLKNRILNEKIGIERNKEMLKFLKTVAEHYGIVEQVEQEKPTVQPLPPQIPSRWMELPKEDMTNVSILNFDSPTELYLLDLTKMNQLKEMKRKIETFAENRAALKNLRDLRVGNHCLVWYEDSYVRGKIWKETPEDSEYHVFLVDEGIIIILNAEEIFEITECLIKDYPFFAIRCALLGVTERASKCSDEEVMFYDEMYEKYFRVPNDKKALCVYSVEEKVFNSDTNWSVRVYFVILVAAEVDDPVLNRCVVEGDFCDKNDKWLHVEQFIQHLDKHPEIMRELSKNLEEIEKEPDWDDVIPAQTVERKSEETTNGTYSALDSDDTATAESSSEAASLPIQPMCQAPKIEWRQTYEDIILYISAVDMNDYRLQVNRNFLTLSIVFEEMPKQGCVINFFGIVDPQRSESKVRGNNIVVRLRKAIAGKRFNWPELMDPPEAVVWLKKKIIDEDESDSDSCCNDPEKPLLRKFGGGESENSSTESVANDSPDSDQDMHFGDHFMPSAK